MAAVFHFVNVITATLALEEVQVSLGLGGLLFPESHGLRGFRDVVQFDGVVPSKLLFPSP